MLTDTKNTKTAHRSSLLSSQWFEMKMKGDGDAKGFLFLFLEGGRGCVQVTSSGKSGEGVGGGKE